MINVLLTGSTGYIGRRLAEKLALDENVRLRLFVRNARKLHDLPGKRVEIAEGSTFDKNSLERALAGMDVAYYLIHSIGARGDFPELERKSALNFRDACIDAGVKRIIYLGGLGTKETASKHLRSRIETGELLSARPERIQILWLRAGIIIGSGSASFEIIRNLVQKLPVLLTPRWVLTKTEPIGVSDVLEYLHQALTLDMPGNLVVDIGSEAMSFKDMLLRAAKAMGLRRRLVRVPFLSPRLSSYWLILLTPVPRRIARALVDGLKSETVIQNENALKYFPSLHPIAYEKAIEQAFAEIEKNQVLSRWCDSSAQESCDLHGQDRVSEAIFVDRRLRDFGNIAPEAVFDEFQSIGGRSGWLAFNWLWRLRGFMDKMAGGPGLSRGRRDPRELRVGDSLDFWKVLDLKKNEHMLLVSQMKVPGKAWLEFNIDGRMLVQTAYFLPKGLLGRLYWYCMKPAHAFIFRNLIRQIIERAGSGRTKNFALKI
jgi:uncharacterized protein YbjT (DUF2867 family)